MGASLSRGSERWACHITVARLRAFFKAKMETSLGTVFHDEFVDEKISTKNFQI